MGLRQIKRVGAKFNSKVGRCGVFWMPPTDSWPLLVALSLHKVLTKGLIEGTSVSVPDLGAMMGLSISKL